MGQVQTVEKTHTEDMFKYVRDVISGKKVLVWFD